MTSSPDTQSRSKRERRERSKRLMVVQVVFYTSVVLFGLWLLSSVVLHLMWNRGPLLGHARISKHPTNVEVFHCYLDTMTLFGVMMDDYGNVTARTRCEPISVKREWASIYSWDTHPWAVVRKGNRVRPEDVGLWRFRKYQVWSRCRLGEDDVLSQVPALADLSRVHKDLDSLRRALTRQLHAHVSLSDGLVRNIRNQLQSTFEKIKNRRRLMKKWKHVIPARLRKWGIRRQPKTTCPI